MPASECTAHAHARSADFGLRPLSDIPPGAQEQSKGFIEMTREVAEGSKEDFEKAFKKIGSVVAVSRS
jgi:hypothetical protein